LPNISDINRRAALTRWRHNRERQPPTAQSAVATPFKKAP
jgi:hypothetical protein